MPASHKKTQLQLTVVGTGAMACLLGAGLASVAETTLTGSWADGIDAIRARGIVVGDPPDCISVPVCAALWGSAIPRADLALILVKSWRTPEIARRLDGLLKPDGIALTLQNGLGNREVLGARACMGVTYLGATLLGPGHVRPGGPGPTWIAGPPWVADLFRQAGIEAELRATAELDALAWGKLAVNCGINAVTALLRVPNGELLRRPDATWLIEQAALECAQVACAQGIQMPFADAAAKAREVAGLTAVQLFLNVAGRDARRAHRSGSNQRQRRRVGESASASPPPLMRYCSIWYVPWSAVGMPDAAWSLLRAIRNSALRALWSAGLVAAL